MALAAKLTDRNAVEMALGEFDRIGRDAFLEKYGFGGAKEYFLVTEEGHYDSKAIFGVAYRNQHGVLLAPDDFSGGASGAARGLADLGYTVEGLDEQVGRLSFDSFEAALKEFRVPVENLTPVRDFVMSRDFVSFFIPPSKPYIAMVAKGDTRATAWVHVGYIWFRNADGTQEGIALPYNRLRSGGGSRSRARIEAAEHECSTPGCGMQLPKSGICEYC